MFDSASLSELVSLVRMLPFSVRLRVGFPVHDEVVYAVKRAIVTGRLRPGDRFPPVRTLSQHLRINPNTAQRILTTLTEQGIVEAKPGVGAFVAEAGRVDEGVALDLLEDQIEALVVEARLLGLSPSTLRNAVDAAWRARSLIRTSQPLAAADENVGEPPKR